METNKGSTDDKIKDLIFSLISDSGYQNHFRNPKIYPMTEENFRDAEALIHNIYTAEIGRLKHGVMNLSREIEVERDDYKSIIEEQEKELVRLQNSSGFFSNFKGYIGAAKAIMLLIISGGLCLLILFVVLFLLSRVDPSASNSAILGIEKLGSSVAKIIEVSK